MRQRSSRAFTAASAFGFFVAGSILLSFVSGTHVVRAQTPPPVALTGQVSSTEEGPMEGVLVTAKRNGSTVAFTVVTDEQGKYAFPAAKLEPGQYALKIRAVGYELAARTTAEVAHHQASTVDLKLRKAQDLAAQLTNAEWMESVPGTKQQKTGLLNCVGCHTLERAMRSRHDADRYVETISRMASYAQQSIPLRPQRKLADRDREVVGEERDRVQRAQAEWLASINLSAASNWEYSLKSFPRPKGKATRVVITEYDLPRLTIEPHDVIVGPDGAVWYSSFGEQNIGKLDPRTGKVTEYAIPEQKKGSPNGVLGLHADPDGNLWVGMMYQAGLAKFDVKTEKVQILSVPADLNKPNTQINMASPQGMAIDGKVWTQNNGFAGVHRIDVKTGKWETFEPFKDGIHNIYDVIADSHNNAYFTDFQAEHIGRIDAKTGAVTLFKTPTSGSAPRRGSMDAQDRLWFGEYRGNRVGMLDTKTAQFKEWEAPTPWSAPYDVVLDKNGEAWTGSMTTDTVLRLDPKTGRFIEYLLPRSTNIRRVFVDDSTTPVTFWVGNNHGASIVKLEPIE